MKTDPFKKLAQSVIDRYSRMPNQSFLKWMEKNKVWEKADIPDDVMEKALSGPFLDHRNILMDWALEKMRKQGSETEVLNKMAFLQGYVTKVSAEPPAWTPAKTFDDLPEKSRKFYDEGFQRLLKDEGELPPGTKGRTYRDTEGNLTTYYGLRADDRLEKELAARKRSLDTATPEQLRELAAERYKESYLKWHNDYMDATGGTGIFPERIASNFSNMEYQMGPGWVKKFPKAVAHTYDQNFQDAVREFGTNADGTGPSKWKQQTPNRHASVMSLFPGKNMNRPSYRNAKGEQVAREGTKSVTGQTTR